jgi:urease accessory protein
MRYAESTSPVGFGDAETQARSGPDAAGGGFVSITRIGPRSGVTRLGAASPLKLLVPRHNATAAWVFASTYGGGLVEGDRIALTVDLAAGSTAMIGTQASTKVYSCRGGRASSQSLLAKVADDALLVQSPDPLVCFAGAIYEQSQRFELSAGGSLVIIDWITSGRMARGERWAFRNYQSRTEVFIDDKLILLDALTLDPADGPITQPHRMGGYNCLATAVLIGPRVKDLAAGIFAAVGEEPVGKRETLIRCASEIPGGTLMRVAGETTESVATYLREKLAPIAQQLGDDPWGRKW